MLPMATPNIDEDLWETGLDERATNKGARGLTIDKDIFDSFWPNRRTTTVF